MKNKTYVPPDHFLEKYAEVLVTFGMQTVTGKPLKKGSVILFEVPDVAKPLYFHLQKAILRAGHHPLGRLLPTDDEEYNFTNNFYTTASKKQREFFPETQYRGTLEQIDGRIAILAKTHPDALKGIDPKYVMQAALAKKVAGDLFFAKVNDGKLAWTLGLWGTEVLAKEAGMSLKAYWNQIIKACYLDVEDPVTAWKEINKTVQKTAKKLSALKIDSVHVTGKDMDVTIGIGADRSWKAGGGCNVPSYEVFTSPDYRRVDGWIRFNQPHYDRYGHLMKDIYLEFKNGVCTKATASKNQAALHALLKAPGGNRLGEFSLTDSRLSRITKFMANTLYDENTGGKFGNMHVALGSAYKDCYQGSKAPKDEQGWDELGYNSSVVHEDIVTTTDRTVEATLSDGTKRIIYKNGQFTL